MKELLVIGAGVHGRIVAETAVQTGLYRVIGFGDDDPCKSGVRIDDWEVLGPWSRLEADIYIVAVGKCELRRDIFERLRVASKPMATIVSPRAYVSERAVLGSGTVVLAGAVIQAGARIGDNVLVNIGAMVDHDAQVADHAHVGPNCTVASFARVEAGELLTHGAVRQRGHAPVRNSHKSLDKC